VQGSRTTRRLKPTAATAERVVSRPPRSEIDPAYRLDTTLVCDDPETWHDERTALDGDLTALEERAARPLGDATQLAELLTATASCHRRFCRLELYATLRDFLGDDETAADLQAGVADLAATLDRVAAAVRRRLATPDDEQFAALLADLDESAAWRPYAERLRARGEHVRSPAVEEALATVDHERTAGRILRAVKGPDLDPEPVERPDGQQVTVTRGNYVEELRHPNRAHRRRVYESLFGALDGVEATLAATFQEHLRARQATATVRGYESLRAAALDAESYPRTGVTERVPPAVHEATLTLRSHTEPYEQARRRRRDRLSVDRLRPWDTRVPTSAADPTVSIETARTVIRAALAPLGEEYVDRVREVFESRRVDLFPTAGKRSGVAAACPWGPTDGPFVVANFRESVRSTCLLAHELGHAVHATLLTERQPREATIPPVVSELPSILHELLVTAELRRRGGDLARAARDRLLELLGGYLYRNTRTTALAHRAATAVAAGDELTPERCREAFRETAAFDPVVDRGKRAGSDWTRYGPSGYDSYVYPVGAAAALVVRDRLSSGDLAPAVYRETLRRAGREGGLAVLRELGVDPTEESTYRRATASFGETVREVRAAET
jgi:oligoendopeptidase F